ncbi:MAG: hypothetical protein UHO11_02175 [Treponema sp.]|nr:hypothetical protein [Treponema sp.]
MTIDELEKKACKIVDAYKGFCIFKEGSIFDKLLFIVLIILYIGASIALFVFNTVVENFLYWIISLIIWICVVIAVYRSQQYILKRETKVYIKGATKESNFFNYFEQKLETHGINRDKYNLYIDYFTNKLNFKRIHNSNELALYITTILCPILINYFTKYKEFEALCISIVGIFIMPALIFSINWFIHRKEYMYEGIIYYLSMGLLLENWDK